MPLELTPPQLQIVKEILAAHVPDCEVLAFGSRVTGKAKRFSDLDLAIIGEAPLPLILYGDICDAFSLSDLPFKVDVVDWATTKENFRAIIRRRCEVLQAAHTHAVH
jgi:predicted nucleotidyltransferase